MKARLQALVDIAKCLKGEICTREEGVVEDMVAWG
jgi:hypothetical protein